MKKFTSALALLFVSVAMFAQTPKYVFMFIGDGMGLNHVFLTNLYNQTMDPDAPVLNFYGFPAKSVINTSSANSLVTDSSAAGTALSSGVKINNGALGYAPDGSFPVSIAEMAQKKGFGTGVVTSVGVNHATPSAFYAHQKSRSSYDAIAEDLFNSKMDFAAGSTFLTNKGTKPEDLVAKAREAGINVFCGRDEYKKLGKGQRVIYLSDHLDVLSIPYAIDRKPGDMELLDFTNAAIDYLYSNYKNGFFLMVEGGKIDYAAHATDAATTIAEINDMAKSVDAALAFMAKHPNETLIIVTADHDTGGLSLSHNGYEMNPALLRGQHVSKDGLTAKLGDLRKATGNNVTWGQVKELFQKELGLWDVVPVSKKDEKRLTQVYKESFLDLDAEQQVNLYSSNDALAALAIEIVDSVACLSWPFSSHSGAPLLLSAKGVRAAEFGTCIDNTDVPKLIAKLAKY